MEVQVAPAQGEDLAVLDPPLRYRRYVSGSAGSLDDGGDQA
jgi:hypothetical protein